MYNFAAANDILAFADNEGCWHELFFMVEGREETRSTCFPGLKCVNDSILWMKIGVTVEKEVAVEFWE